MKENSSILLIHFTNSYDQKDCIAILKREYMNALIDKDSNYYDNLYVFSQLGIVKGYTKYTEYGDYRYMNKFVIYKDIGVVYSLGLEYRFNDYISVETEVFGTVIVSGIKIQLK